MDLALDGRASLGVLAAARDDQNIISKKVAVVEQQRDVCVASKGSGRGGRARRSAAPRVERREVGGDTPSAVRAAATASTFEAAARALAAAAWPASAERGDGGRRRVGRAARVAPPQEARDAVAVAHGAEGGATRRWSRRRGGRAVRVLAAPCGFCSSYIAAVRARA